MPDLTRYNVVPKQVGGPHEWEYEAADDGQILFADSALERIRELEAQVAAQQSEKAAR